MFKGPGYLIFIVVFLAASSVVVVDQYSKALVSSVRDIQADTMVSSAFAPSRRFSR